MPDAPETVSLDAAPGRVTLRGTLTFATVEGLVDDAARVLSAQQQGRVEVDLSGVGHADSAGLALLIGWIAAARAAQVTLTFRGVPARLRAIARISEVEDLLVGGGAVQA